LVVFFALAILITITVMIVTISRLNYRIFDRPRSKGIMTEDRALSWRLFRRMLFIVDPQRRKAGVPFYLNAVMVKEFRCRRFGRSHWLIRLIAICAVASLLLTFAATTGTVDWGVETIGGLMVLLQVVLVVLIAPSLAAGLISTERETGGWDLLRMTPLSASSIVTGKLLSVVWTLLLVLMATLPGYLVMIYIKPVMWLQVYLVLICLFLAALLTLFISVLVSSLFSRTAAATTTAYIVLIALFLGPLIVWLGRDQLFGHRAVELALTVNPMGAALAVIGAPGFAQYELIPFSWWVCVVALVVLLVVLVFQTWRLTRAL
jgi:ABC-type transport system involved in multi-copper enzyme maturation permease subunit